MRWGLFWGGGHLLGEPWWLESQTWTILGQALHTCTHRYDQGIINQSHDLNTITWIRCWPETRHGWLQIQIWKVPQQQTWPFKSPWIHKRCLKQETLQNVTQIFMSFFLLAALMTVYFTICSKPHFDVWPFMELNTEHNSGGHVSKCQCLWLIYHEQRELSCPWWNLFTI